jgi:hypothetical protein
MDKPDTAWKGPGPTGVFTRDAEGSGKTALPDLSACATQLMKIGYDLPNFPPQHPLPSRAELEFARIVHNCSIQPRQPAAIVLNRHGNPY